VNTDRPHPLSGVARFSAALLGVAVLGVVLLAAVLAAPAVADLAEPATNTGATQVEVTGTKVSAEAWAVADGHRVETLVVTRLVPRPEKRSTVETYERWSVDGHKKFERGNGKLGRRWEKTLRTLLAGVKADHKAGHGKKKKDLLGRLRRSLGPRGSKTVGDWVVGWSIGEGRARKGGRASLGRVAVITFTPGAPPPVATPRKDDPAAPPAVTPRKQGTKPAPAPTAPKGRRPGPVEPPTTPGAGPKAPPPHRPWPEGFPRPGQGSSSASGSVEASADSEKGVRQHATVVVDLARIAQPTTPAPKKPAPHGPEVTPGSR